MIRHPVRRSGPNATILAGDVAEGFRAIVRPVLPWGAALLLLIAAAIFQDSVSRALLLLGLGGVTLIGMAIWCERAGPCLPVMPIMLFTNLLVYGLPALRFSLVELPDPFLELAIVPVILWTLAMVLGWVLVPRSWFRQPFGTSMAESLQALIWLPHGLIAVALGLQWLIGTSFYWEALGPLAKALLNVVNTVIALAILPGGFIGSYRWARGQLREPPIYWTLVLLLLINYLLSFLLSSAQYLVLGVLLGLWIGRSRQALAITLSFVLVLSFLQPGKYIMRGKYWGTGVTPPSPPELLLEWIGVSYDQLFSPQKSDAQGLDRRVNNLAMVVYVNAQLQNGTAPLNGASYALIPQVLIPRVLNPDKVRSQEGQVLLNLYFGRQATREQTETTYIAWGLLPESIGNFGPWFGPLIVGMLVGAAMRASELWGAGQDLLSKFGLEALVLMMLWAGSYELVASTFSAAAFQIILMIELLNWYLNQQRFTRQRPGL